MRFDIHFRLVKVEITEHKQNDHDSRMQDKLGKTNADGILQKESYVGL